MSAETETVTFDYLRVMRGTIDLVLPQLAEEGKAVFEGPHDPLDNLMLTYTALAEGAEQKFDDDVQASEAFVRLVRPVAAGSVALLASAMLYATDMAKKAGKLPAADEIEPEKQSALFDALTRAMPDLMAEVRAGIDRKSYPAADFWAAVKEASDVANRPRDGDVGEELRRGPHIMLPVFRRVAAEALRCLAMYSIQVEMEQEGHSVFDTAERLIRGTH